MPNEEHSQGAHFPSLALKPVGGSTTDLWSPSQPSAFAVHGPMAWNFLPDDLRAQQDYESFRQGLKTWLFSRYFSRLHTHTVVAI